MSGAYCKRCSDRQLWLAYFPVKNHKLKLMLMFARIVRYFYIELNIMSRE